jgi:lysophospholipase L1-like esterase
MSFGKLGAMGRGMGHLGALGGLRALYPVLGVLASPPTATWKGNGTTAITSPVTYNQLSGVWRYLNATATHASGYYQVTPSTAQGFIADTETASDEVDLRFLRFNSSINIFVNRQPISATGFTTDAAGSADLLQLRFAGTPLEGTVKRIRVYGRNVLFAGMYISTGKTAAIPTNNRPVYAIEGDSYTADTGAGAPGLAYYRYCFEALGYDVVMDGVGSTGYLTAAGATAAETRMTNRIGVLPYAPDRIGILLGLNDAGGNMTTLATNHAATVAAANTAHPGVPVDTWGPWTPQGETANLALVKNALIASAAANNSAYFNIADIINSGNKATYGLASEAPNYVHPNADGHIFLGGQMAFLGRAAGIMV